MEVHDSFRVLLHGGSRCDDFTITSQFLHDSFPVYFVKVHDDFTITLQLLHDYFTVYFTMNSQLVQDGGSRFLPGLLLGGSR